MENEFTEEEIEAIKLSDEMLEDMNYQDMHQKKFHPNEIKTVINKENLKNRQFKSTFCGELKKLAPILGVAVIASATITSNSFATAIKENTQIKSAVVLAAEVEMHGGKKDLNTDKYIWNLDKHLQSGKCEIPEEDNLTIEDRIEKYCRNKGLSDEVADAAIAKFNLYYSNNTKEADKIELVKMVKEEQELLKEENSYTNRK